MIMINRAIHVAKANNDESLVSISYNYKGIVLKTRGDLDGAEAMYKKSLEIAEEVGLKPISKFLNQKIKK